MTHAQHSHETQRRHDELARWFLRRSGSPWTAADEADFQRWLDVPGNRAAHDQWAADWQLMDALPQASADRLRTMVAQDRARAIPPIAEPARAPRPGMAAGMSGVLPDRRRMLTIAGVAALTASGSWLGWQHLQAPVYEQAFSTRRGQQVQAQLPDGSVLSLDTATELRAVFFRNRREVHLASGQALFSVEADAARPFQVMAGAVQVTVVGTRFTVRLTPGIPGREGVEVVVEHGRVHVASDSGPAPQVFDLTAGQRLVFDSQGQRPVLAATSLEDVASWRGMQLSFSDVPLQQALDEMARYGDLGISAVAPAAARLRLTGTFDPRNAAATRRLLAGALPITMVQTSAGLEVRLAR